MTGSDAIHKIADEAALSAVKRTFTALGIDIEDADEIRHFQANMAWIWRFRRSAEKVGTTVLLTLATLLTGGIVKLLWDGFKAKAGH